MQPQQQQDMDPRWTKILDKRRQRQAILDSGATSGAAGEDDEYALIDTGLPSRKTFMFPNNTTQKATKLMKLKHKIRSKAAEMNIIPGLHAPLVSVPKLADDDYTTVFDKKEAKVYDATTTTILATKTPVLIAKRCQQSGLWKMPLDPQSVADTVPTPSDEGLNTIFDLPSNKQTARWYHAAAGFPEEATFIEAIRKGNYSTWPGLNVTMMSKHFPESIETKKGHMKGARQGIRSSKNTQKNTAEDGTRIKIEGGAAYSTLRHQHDPIEKLSDIYFKEVEMSETIYSDDTGAFPYVSQRGKKIVMVAIHIDSNYIFAETLRNKTEGERIHAYQKIIDRMRRAKLGLKKHILDNEISKAFKERIIENNMTYELVPPSNHRRNIAERAIQTFKSHFISILNGVSDKFPMTLWCQLVPQAELTLNLLRQSHITPAISAFAHVHGHHDYMRQPFAPMGSEIEVHVKPGDRRTWDMRCDSGFSLGTSMEHYRCYKVHVTKTKSTRVSDQVDFLHKYITKPDMSPESYVVAAAKELTTALKGNIMSGTTTADELTKLSELFSNVAQARHEAAERRQQQDVHQRTIRLYPDNSTETAAPRVVLQIPPIESTPTLEIPVPRVNAVQVPRVNVAQNTRSQQRNSTTPNYISQDEDDDEQHTKMHEQRYPRRIHQTVNQVLMANDLSYDVAMMVNETSTKTTKPNSGTSWLGEMANSVLGKDGAILEYRHLIADPATRAVWQRAFGNEIGRLAQGMPGRVEGTNTIFFIRRTDIPADRKGDVTYIGYVASYRPEKEDPNRLRMVVGGDRVNYPGDVGTPTAELLTIKLLVNSVISTKNAKMLTLDLKDFYLNTPMERFEYARIKLSDIPDDVIKHYKLKEIVEPDGYVYARIERGMYGLPQAGIIAQELLEERLGEDGYYQSQLTPGLWKHRSRPTIFTLVVDDFAIKYLNNDDAHHLINALKKNYTCSEDWSAERYCGITFKWDYDSNERKVHCEMPDAVQKALLRFKHIAPSKPQYQPYPHIKPNYGAKAQYEAQPDNSPKLDKIGTKFIQEVTGVFLFMARAINGRLLPALSALASQQASPTEETMRNCKIFLDHMATEPAMILTYRASDMVLAVHSDASYLSEPGSRSRIGGHFFMAGHEEIPRNNGAILNISAIYKNVLASAAEAEIAGIFTNVKAAIPIRQTLEEMGHPQPPTPTQTDNSTAHSLIANKIRPKALKSMEMRFNFLKCRQAQQQFRFYWRPGTQNLADYFTKHHAPSHHINTRPLYLTNPNDPEYTKLLQTNTFAGKLLNTEKYKVLAQAHFLKTVSSCTKQGCVRLRDLR